MTSGTRAFWLFMLLLLSGAAHAQTMETPNIEYPNDLCALRAENRVFVHAPLSTRQKILKELSKHSDLLIVERPEEADFLILFTYTPFSDGSEDGNPLDGSGAITARAELTVVKFVNRSEEQVRPRVLFYWASQKSFHSIPIPLRGLSPNGFALPTSGKSAGGELIVRLAMWLIHKKWPRTFYFDQFTNQLTISTGGKLEIKGTKAFLNELKTARSDAYASRCVSRPALPLAAPEIPTRPAPHVVFPDPPAPAEPPSLTEGPQEAHPPTGNGPPSGEVRPRSVKRSRKER
jgi:hypothetical protein